MGHGHSKTKGTSSSYQSDKSLQPKEEDHNLQNAQREFPKVHGSGSVTSVDCIEGAPLCLSGDSEGRLAVFDVNATKLIKRWQAHEKQITKAINVGVEPLVFSASRDKLIKIWTKEDNKPMQTMRGHTLGVSAITCNKDGSFLVSGSRDNSVRLWDTKTGNCVKQSSLPRNMVTSVTWVEDTNLVVQTGEDKIMKLWDTRTMQVARNFPIKQYFQTSCDVSEDGSYILTGSTGFNGNGCDVATWDVREGKLLREYKGHSQKVTDCCFLTGRQARKSLLMSVSVDCSVKVWSPDRSDCLLSEIIPAAKEITSISSLKDGRFVVGTFEYGIHLFKLGEEGDELSMLPVLRF